MIREAATRGAMRPPVIVVVVVTVVLALAAAVVVVATLGDDDPPTPATTTSAAPTTSTTVLLERQVSLVEDDEAGRLFAVAGVEVTAEALRAVTAGDSVAERYPVLIDPTFVAAQEEADLSLTRLRRQVRFLANRLGPAIEEAGLEPALAVVSRPRFDRGTVDAAVLVVNTLDTSRHLEFVDLRLLDAEGAPATERVRFLADAGGVEVPAGTAYFNLVAFSEAQVLDPDADFTEYGWEGDVRWREDASA